MSDQWFQIAGIDHFWMRRRFEVFRKLAGGLITNAREIAEIGCGHGVLQLQIENAYDREVAGFDLNDLALKQNVSRRSAVSCYNIYERDPALREKFDLIFLFDVLEHVADEDGFLNALLFHLARGGKLVINVPAGMWAYCAFDSAVGHVRRYSIDSLRETAERNNLVIKRCTYWGLPLVPTMVVRKLWPMGRGDKNKIVSAGFDSRNKIVDQLLGAICKCEAIPQEFSGSSVMAVLEVDQDTV
jgi:SAM-dependent methyltransferase